jgi:uncharacterized lipoprotein YddW (UPF0748 family)
MVVRISAFVLVLFFSLNAFSQAKPEFRAAWIATVAHIDWPSPGNYNSILQQQEFIRILDMHKANGMNAVIVQVRPSSDAFYPSPYEPWSQWLTGVQGKAPNPYYDPLQFMIEEAHKRGMEFHAWCNPYRADFSIGKSSIAPNHVTRTHPEWFISYGGKKYFDPGNPNAREHVVKVIKDLVSRYDVDGIHFDDYFYPYKIPGREFPDHVSYNKYGKGMTRDAWRRSNVDSIIYQLHVAIKEIKPAVKFGISPFGVWRNADKDPNGSPTRAGVTNYDDLYADVLLWLKNGWIDYVAPQLYWEIGHRAAPFEVLVDWWSKNTYGRHCYIGIGYYLAGSNTAWKDPTLLPRQLELIRSYKEIQGAVFYNTNAFFRNPLGWNDTLRLNYFKHPADIPVMPWLDSLSSPIKYIIAASIDSLEKEMKFGELKLEEGN